MSEEKRTRVVIQSTEKEPEVFVAVNGRTFLIKTGEPVELPDSAIEVLKNAVQINYKAEATPEGLRRLKPVSERKYMVEVA